MLRAKKFEAVRIQFLCDVFAAVAASLETIRNYDGNGNGDDKVIKQKVKAPSAPMRFIFSAVWPTVRTYPVKTVTENACF